MKIEAAIEAAEVDRSVDRAAKSLAGEMKMPGFRKGKVPPQLVIQRIGREAVVEQALRDSLPEWYERALIASGVAAIGEPKLDVGELPAAGRGSRVHDRGRGPPDRRARRLQGPRGRQGEDRGA